MLLDLVSRMRGHRCGHGRGRSRHEHRLSQACLGCHRVTIATAAYRPLHRPILRTDYNSLKPLTAHYSLLTTHYSPLTTHHALLATHYSPRTTHYSLLATLHILPVAQVMREYRKPLVIMSPKSLLRHRLVRSDIDEFLPGTCASTHGPHTSVDAR